MGHVNNAVYSTYLEQARIGILGDLEPFILARVEIDFRAELRSGEDVEVRSRCAHVGTKSFSLEHQIWSGERLVADAKSVLSATGRAGRVGRRGPQAEDARRQLALGPCVLQRGPPPREVVEHHPQAPGGVGPADREPTKETH